MDNFCAFILSYGRPENVKTYKTLKKYGYKGDFRIICSDDDKTLDKYKETFGDKVCVFSKEEQSKRFDVGDNLKDWRTIVFARNACFEIAKEQGYKYFIQLDDDYTSFNYRVNSEGKYTTKKTRINNITTFFEIMLRFYKKTSALTICMGQAGDFVGGESCSLFKKGLGRKAMNSFVCSTDRPFQFIGRVNEDVNTYVNRGNKGDLFFTACEFALTQELTQTNKGGMSDTYALEGTYIKSFYTVMYNPSSVKVGLMGAKNRRLHHKINWNKAVPKILDSRHKK